MAQRPLSDVHEVLRLDGAGFSKAEIARRTALSRATVHSWLRCDDWILRRLSVGECPACTCPPHRFDELPSRDYSYLLGVYLGDGYIRPNGGSSFVLQISLDSCYSGIVRASAEAIERVIGHPPKINPDATRRMVRVNSFSKAWPCLLPQHGPGKKHARRIELVAWQQEIVDAEPEAFLRGLIHTDGWRGLNRVTVKGRDYAYPRYQFSNRSDDIRTLFTDTCDKLGIAWRPWGRWHISVARRDAVAYMDTFIGPKA
jgi:hypothetical protein